MTIFRGKAAYSVYDSQYLFSRFLIAFVVAYYQNDNYSQGHPSQVGNKISSISFTISSSV